MSRKILLASEVASEMYEGSKSAKQAFGLLGLLALYYVLSFFYMVLFSMDIYGVFVFADFMFIFMMIVVCLIFFCVYQAQRSLAWLDYYSLSEIFVALKKDGLLCYVVNDLAKDQTKDQSKDQNKAQERQNKELKRINQTSEILSPYEIALRKQTISKVKYALWNTAPEVIKGILLFFFGILLFLIQAFVPAGPVDILFFVGAWLSVVGGWLTWFIAWYKLL